MKKTITTGTTVGGNEVSKTTNEVVRGFFQFCAKFEGLLPLLTLFNGSGLPVKQIGQLMLLPRLPLE